MKTLFMENFFFVFYVAYTFMGMWYLKLRFMNYDWSSHHHHQIVFQIMSATYFSVNSILHSFQSFDQSLLLPMFHCNWVPQQCVTYSGEHPSLIIECCFFRIHVWIVGCHLYPNTTILYSGLTVKIGEVEWWLKYASQCIDISGGI